MAGRGISLLHGAARPRRYGFAMTPLADAMFQLLIFFMLSSSLSPYSLIALTGGAPAGQSPSALLPGPAPEPASGPAAKMVIWQLTRGRIRSGDQSIALADLPSAISSLIADEVNEVLIYPARSATVQVRLVSGSQVAGG